MYSRLSKGCSCVEKELLVYCFDDEKGNVKLYPINGKTRRTAKETFFKMQKKPEDYMFQLIPTIEGKSMKETHSMYKEYAEQLKEATEGTINMFKTGNIKRTVLELFGRFNKNITVEDITVKEFNWLEDGTMGSLTYAEEYKGIGYLFDFCSMYPGILSSLNFMLPIKEGEFSYISKEEFEAKKYFSVGIYHCQVEKSTDENINKLFKFNRKNKYTNIDLQRAKELKLNINHIDKKPNALIYSRDKLINGNKVFKQYVDLLFDLKYRNVAGNAPKQLLNQLWGLLCEKRELSKVIDEDDTENFELSKGRTVTSITPLNDNKLLVKYAIQKRLYETPFARLKPFLLAYGRKNLSRIVEKIIDKVKWMHTDGFIVTEKVEVKTGDKLGELKYCGYYANTEITRTNCKTPSKLFKK